MERNLAQGVTFNAVNYLDLGTLGNLGSSLASGFYCKFTISNGNLIAIDSLWGFQHSGTASKIIIVLNSGVKGGIKLRVMDVVGLSVTAHTTSPTVIADGNAHTVILQSDPITTKTISIIVDNANQPLTYDATDTLGTLANFDAGFNVGTMFYDGSHISGTKCNLHEFKMGISASNLYVDLPLTEGSGVTARDVSGRGSNATLVSSPTWIKRTLVT